MKANNLSRCRMHAQKLQLKKASNKGSFDEAFNFERLISGDLICSTSLERRQNHVIDLKLTREGKGIKLKSDVAIILFLDAIAHLTGATLVDLIFWIDCQRKPTQLSLNEALTRYACMFFYMKCHYPMVENLRFNPIGVPSLKSLNRNFKVMPTVINAYCAELNINPQKFKKMYLNKAKSPKRKGLNYNGFDYD